MSEKELMKTINRLEKVGHKQPIGLLHFTSFRLNMTVTITVIVTTKMIVYAQCCV